jgi:transposase-like protein
MQTETPFKWRHARGRDYFAVRPLVRGDTCSVTRTWRCMMAERGLSVGHTTIYRWVQHYAPELEKRCRPHLKTTTDSWHVDETLFVDNSIDGV